MSWEAPSEAFGVPAIAPPRPRIGLFATAAALVLLAPPLAGFVLHNGLVSKQEAVDAAWAQVESAHQRRADLVPALVASTKRHLRHEVETLVAVVEARSRAVRDLAGARAPAGSQDLARIASAQRALGAGLEQLVVVAESHPELRSADSFLELQAQLEGAENRIHVARVAYNDAVRAYNAAIQKLPGAWIAGARGMQKRAYFESDEGAGRARPLGLE